MKKQVVVHRRNKPAALESPGSRLGIKKHLELSFPVLGTFPRIGGTAFSPGADTVEVSGEFLNPQEEEMFSHSIIWSSEQNPEQSFYTANKLYIDIVFFPFLFKEI